jgi:hypothetical protein
MKNEGALRMRFSRQGGIYRSDVFSLLVNPVQMPPPVGRPRYRAIGRAGRSNTPCPSSAMSSALAIPQRVARQHCPSPLHQQCQIKSFAPSTEMLYHRPVHSLLFVCLSQGDKPIVFPLALVPTKILRGPRSRETLSRLLKPSISMCSITPRPSAIPAYRPLPSRRGRRGRCGRRRGNCDYEMGTDSRRTSRRGRC